MVLRDCHVGLRPPRNDKPSAFAVLLTACLLHQCSAGSGMPLPYNGVCDQRECLPEIATGAKRPRNDTSGGAVVHQRPPAIEWLCTRRSLSAATPHILAFTVLSLTCTDRQHSAGSGMPLPYNGVCDQRECLPEIATGAKRPRNDTSGSAKVHQRPCTVELPRTGRSGSAAAIRPASWCGRWSGRKFVSRARGNNEDLRRQENAVSAFP